MTAPKVYWPYQTKQNKQITAHSLNSYNTFIFAQNKSAKTWLLPVRFTITDFPLPPFLSYRTPSPSLCLSLILAFSGHALGPWCSKLQSQPPVHYFMSLNAIYNYVNLFSLLHSYFLSIFLLCNLSFGWRRDSNYVVHHFIASD